MDLVRMSVEANAKQRKLTWLYTETPWTPGEVAQLVNGLMNEIISHPQHPNHLVVRGEYSKELISSLLSRTDYSHTILVGTPNPEVPFPVPL